MEGGGEMDRLRDSPGGPLCFHPPAESVSRAGEGARSRQRLQTASGPSLHPRGHRAATARPSAPSAPAPEALWCVCVCVCVCLCECVFVLGGGAGFSGGGVRRRLCEGVLSRFRGKRLNGATHLLRLPSVVSVCRCCVEADGGQRLK